MTDGDKEPKHWKKGNKIPGVEYIWVQKAKMKETSFLQIKKTEKRFFPIASWRQQIEYDGKSEAILVSSQVKADEVTKAILDVIFLDKNNRVISHKWAAYIGRKNSSEPAVTHDWKRYSGTVDVPSNTAKIAISLQCYGPGTVSFSKVTAQFSD